MVVLNSLILTDFNCAWQKDLNFEDNLRSKFPEGERRKHNITYIKTLKPDYIQIWNIFLIFSSWATTSKQITPNLHNSCQWKKRNNNADSRVKNPVKNTWQARFIHVVLLEYFLLGYFLYLWHYVIIFYMIVTCDKVHCKMSQAFIGGATEWKGHN